MGWFGFMPSFEELENPQTYLASEIISHDNQLLGTYYIENRSKIYYQNISPYLIDALIATEDVRFMEHSGIDVKALGRVERTHVEVRGVCLKCAAKKKESSGTVEARRG